MAFRFILIWLSVFLLAGCQEKSGPPVAVDPPASNEAGNLVACYLSYKQYEERPVFVTADAGIWMTWIGEEKSFYLLNNRSKEIFRTQDFGAFLAKLDALPEKSEIQRFETCAGSACSDMPEENWKRLEKVMEQGKKSWAIDPVRESPYFSVCTCESVALRFPQPTPPFIHGNPPPARR